MLFCLATPANSSSWRRLEPASVISLGTGFESAGLYRRRKNTDEERKPKIWILSAFSSLSTSNFRACNALLCFRTPISNEILTEFNLDAGKGSFNATALTLIPNVFAMPVRKNNFSADPKTNGVYWSNVASPTMVEYLSKTCMSNWPAALSKTPPTCMFFNRITALSK